jgi:hypothetical protein
METWSVAVPELSGAVPNVVFPLRNVTLPVGMPLVVGSAVTVAVRVTGWPIVTTVGETCKDVKVGTARSERSSRRSTARRRRVVGFRFDMRADRANERKTFRNITVTSLIACWFSSLAAGSHHTAETLLIWLPKATDKTTPGLEGVNNTIVRRAQCQFGLEKYAMPDGNALVGASGQGTLLVVNPRDAIVREIKVLNTPRHSCMRNARQVANGNYPVAKHQYIRPGKAAAMWATRQRRASADGVDHHPVVSIHGRSFATREFHSASRAAGTMLGKMGWPAPGSVENCAPTPARLRAANICRACFGREKQHPLLAFGNLTIEARLPTLLPLSSPLPRSRPILAALAGAADRHLHAQLLGQSGLGP